MNAKERRGLIMQQLSDANAPISATALAALCGVSRQIIVGDIALIRAGGMNVLATPRGYILDTIPTEVKYVEKKIACQHTDESLLDELYTVVDLGGALIDVTVSHSVYGQITAPLHIFSRYDADMFYSKLKKSGARPLCDLTDGIHLHILRANSDDIIMRIIEALKEKGFLFFENNNED